MSALVNNVLIVRFGSIQFERCLISALHAFFCVLKLLCQNTFHAVFHVSWAIKNCLFNSAGWSEEAKLLNILSHIFIMTSVSTVP